jgi:hypothetical protein
LLLRPLSVGRFASLRFRPKNMAHHIFQLETELQNIPEAAPSSPSFSVSEKLARLRFIRIVRRGASGGNGSAIGSYRSVPPVTPGRIGFAAKNPSPAFSLAVSLLPVREDEVGVAIAGGPLWNGFHNGPRRNPK